MRALVEMIVPVENGEVAVTIQPGPEGAAALATLLEGGCPVCSTALTAGGVCPSCSDERGPVRYAAVAEGQS